MKMVYPLLEVITVSVSASVKALLYIQGKKQSDLMQILQMSSKQSLSNKFSNNRWSGDDLAVVAEFCGGKLAFVLPDGQQINIEPMKAKSPDD
jgi:hypothetical protein